MILKEVSIQGEGSSKVHPLRLCYNFSVARPLFRSLFSIIRSLISKVYSLGFRVFLDDVD